MSKGEKFLSYGDRWELCWFFESSAAATAGERSSALTKRERFGDASAAIADPDGAAVERLQLGEIRSKVRAVLERMVADAPEPLPFPLGGRTRGEDFVFELHQAYVAPGLIRGALPGPVRVEVHDQGERQVLRLRSGALVQAHNGLPVPGSAPPDAIPGLVCCEGDGKVDVAARRRLAKACAAYRAAREALGLPERDHARFEMLSAHAAELAGVDRSTMGRVETLPLGTLPAKQGARQYKTITVSSDDASDAEKKDSLELIFQRIREMSAEAHARLAQFARKEPSK